jgi:uncharacterized protein Yka (UPF0111/DUF47 family)
MISFQRLLGRENEFCDLLEASAGEAVHAVDALKRMLLNRDGTVTLHEFADARSKDKAITEKLSEMLITTFVTPMEREDIEALAHALYRIPKTVEKFAERYRISADKIKDVDFSKQVDLMEQAVKLVAQIVAALRAGRNLGGIKAIQQQIQAIESQADDLLLAMERPFYEPGFPVLKAIILKDLFALNEKVVDRCRDAGNVISHIVLKNS